MDGISVTACIVTYNNVSCIKECIESVLKETKIENFKLIISDNCSVDGTVQLIRSTFPEVTVIENEYNGGFGYGHNKVLGELDSKYHLVINPDIVLGEDVISKLVSFMEKHDEVGMITPRILNRDGTEQYLPKRDPSIRYVIVSKFKPFRYFRDEYTRKMENLKVATEVDSCTGCFFMIRTQLFQQLKGFDDKFFMYYEDADLSRRARAYQKLIFYPESYVFHDWKRDNIRSVNGIVSFLKSMLIYFKKWKWRF